MSHGGNIYAMAASLGIEWRKMIDFSASINPLGLSPAVKAAIQNGMDTVLNYPDPDATALARSISEAYGLRPGRVLCGNGSTELIFLLPRALRPASVLIACPTFSEYERACRLAGAEIKYLKTGKENFFIPDPGSFIQAMQGCQMAFLCNPGNPSGKAMDKNHVVELIRAAERMKVVMVVDEAFMDFCPAYSVLEHESAYLVVLRSLTKFYALAGLRVGFAVLSGTLMEKVRSFKEPWSVNCLAQTAATAALKDAGHAARTRQYIDRQKAFLADGFRNLKIRCYPSDVNYMLLEVEGAEEVAGALFQQGIAVRTCSDFKGLDRNFMRVAVKKQRENQTLLQALVRLMTGAG